MDDDIYYYWFFYNSLEQGAGRRFTETLSGLRWQRLWWDIDTDDGLSDEDEPPFHPAIDGHLLFDTDTTPTNCQEARILFPYAYLRALSSNHTEDLIDLIDVYIYDFLTFLSVHTEDWFRDLIRNMWVTDRREMFREGSIWDWCGACRQRAAGCEHMVLRDVFVIVWIGLCHYLIIEDPDLPLLGWTRRREWSA